jgi:uroporphyrinogen-III synthase
MAEDRGSSPVLLLKTKSKPTDAYEDLFASRAAQGGLTFTSYFVPVMEHRFTDKGLQEVTSFLEAGQFCDRAEAKDGYGGIIFTSQRAVEAFAHVVGTPKPETANSGSSMHWGHPFCP